MFPRNSASRIASSAVRLALQIASGRRLAPALGPALVATLMLGACSHSESALDVPTQPTAVIANDGAAPMPDPEGIAREAKAVPASLSGGPATARHMAPHAVADTDAPYLLDSGDRIRVFVYGQPNLSRVYAIDGGGFISMPLIGAVKSRGETTFDIERAVTVQLGAKYVKDPKVSVEIASYRPFFILGEVRAAGQYAYVSGMTVQTAVAIAGGYSERAVERKVVVTRRINGVIEKLRLNADAPVLPGDTIKVEERFF